MKTESTEPVVGKAYLLLTRGYHWTGRLIASTALEYVLDDACCFVDVGQLDGAFVGQWSSEARGRPVPSGQLVRITRLGTELVDYSGELPRDAIG